MLFARSEASVSRFNLRRVVRFTYPRCAFQTMHMPYPLPLPLSLPGLGIRTELKGVCLSLFGPNLAVFIFLFSARTMWFWLILAKKNLFWANLAKKSGFGQFWPENWFLTKKTGFGRF